MSKQRKLRKGDILKRFAKACGPLTPPVLCVGVDVTWWGGSAKKSDKSSRMECVASAVRNVNGWESPTFARIDLNSTFNEGADQYTPNADPKAACLLAKLQQIVGEHPEVANVVLALDAPLIAIDRKLPPRSKSKKNKKKKKVKDRRGCDQLWQECLAASPKGWRNAQVQPGAPVPTRISSMVKALEQADFKLYSEPSQPLSNRTLIECFPNEVIWSAGVLGLCGSHTYSSMVGYKRMGKNRTVLPLSILEAICAHTLLPCLAVAGLPDDDWLATFWGWLSEDSAFATDVEGTTGKGFDDAIDSMLSLISAAAFASGNAHVHQDISDDGHIIGPGLPAKVRTETGQPK